MAAELIVGIGGDGSGTAAARTAARVANLMNAKLVLVFGYDPTSLGPRGGSLEDEILAIGRRAVEAVHAELAGDLPGSRDRIRVRPGSRRRGTDPGRRSSAKQRSSRSATVAAAPSGARCSARSPTSWCIALRYPCSSCPTTPPTTPARE